MSTSNQRNPFIDALVSPQRSADLADADDLFDFFIGSWDIDAVLYDITGTSRRIKGEVHASWILQGRAIQDLFIFPRRADRRTGLQAQDDRYGTTIRTYDRKQGLWRITFINPAADETSARLFAHRDGNEIAMEGSLAEGTPIRWHYVEATPSLFHYTAHRLQDGNSWRLYLELFGTRPQI